MFLQINLLFFFTLQSIELLKNVGIKKKLKYLLIFKQGVELLVKIRVLKTIRVFLFKHDTKVLINIEIIKNIKNFSFKQGVELLINVGIIKNTERSVAKFLYSTPTLSKTSIGIYLGEGLVL